jgi:hypothetical protein
LQKISRAFRRTTSYYIEFTEPQAGDTEGRTVTRPILTTVHTATRPGFAIAAVHPGLKLKNFAFEEEEKIGPLQPPFALPLPSASLPSAL